VAIKGEALGSDTYMRSVDHAPLFARQRVHRKPQTRQLGADTLHVLGKVFEYADHHAPLLGMALDQIGNSRGRTVDPFQGKIARRVAYAAGFRLV
jgi:hypothetical protein